MSQILSQYFAGPHIPAINARVVTLLSTKSGGPLDISLRSAELRRENAAIGIKVDLSSDDARRATVLSNLHLDTEMIVAQARPRYAGSIWRA